MADFSMFAGDTRTLNVTVNDEDGAPIDLSSASIRWQLARTPISTALIQKTLVSGISVVDAPNGRFSVSLASADTDALNGEYYHEAEIVIAGSVSTVLTGVAQITATLIRG